MNTPLSTPIRQAKLGITTSKSLPLANEYKKLLNEQYQRLWTKHQQDLDLIDDIRSYVKARLSIEKDYTNALSKLGKQHSAHINKKFSLLNQCDGPTHHDLAHQESTTSKKDNQDMNIINESEVSDSRLQKRLANNGLDEPDKACSLYKVWCEHINRLQTTSKNRSNQFEQLIMVVDKLKDIRSHKAYTGKKCLDTHLRRIQEDVVVSVSEVEKARKLYYEDESQAKKARENEEKIRKKRSGLLTKFTDLQAKKEKTSAQREANDIQSTQARNDYIMALAAANAHLLHYYNKDLSDFIQIIDDGVLDHCKIFMATLSECDLNSLKDSLSHAQYWSKMINLTGSQKTNQIFLDCEQSACLKSTLNISFEACNDDPIQTISLEHNADYALQHEIDKWLTWFKKECFNLSQLTHQLETCQRAFSEGKKTIEMNGQNEDLEHKIIELKQQIRKCEAAKLRAQARLKVIREGGMHIEDWSVVESEIRADMARAQEEQEARRAKEMHNNRDTSDSGGDQGGRDSSGTDHQQGNKPTTAYSFDNQVNTQVQVTKDSDDSDDDQSTHNLASVSRSTSNLIQKQQNAMSGYSALTDPSLVWQEDYSKAWGANQGSYNVVVTDTFDSNTSPKSPIDAKTPDANSNRYNLLGASKPQTNSQMVNSQNATMTVQSSSPLSAIVDGGQTSPSPYQALGGDAYKSDYECDYNRTGQMMGSAASSAEPYNQYLQQAQTDPFGKPLDGSSSHQESKALNEKTGFGSSADGFDGDQEAITESAEMLNQRVIAIYSFDKTNEDDLSFNEHDVLRVIEVNDANWVKARNEATGEQGFVPTSYIRVLEDDHDGDVKDSKVDEEKLNAQNEQSMDSEFTWNTRDLKQGEEDNQTVPYCKALYDYKPEGDAYEEDGLPHLTLTQGELMKIIDQGEDDGWWLVEKEGSGVRGHVPSMLVEEIDADEDDQEEYEDDDGDGSEYSDRDELDGSVKAMPTFEPPVLQRSIDEDNGEQKLENSNDFNNNRVEEDKSSKTSEDIRQTGSSLVPTSFIIIEPTPEVESKQLGDPIEGIDESNKSESAEEHCEDRQVVHNSEPPNDVSYSVVNEEFVLEKPTRKPHQQSEHQMQHHETPTILEEIPGEELMENLDADSSSRCPDEVYDPPSEADSSEMPAPPSVVIEVFDDAKRSESASIDEENNCDQVSLNELENDEQPVTNYVHKGIKHTGNVDVNPMLRHRAEEFSKQIIAEAIMLAPGADVGPSTSTANVI